MKNVNDQPLATENNAVRTAPALDVDEEIRLIRDEWSERGAVAPPLAAPGIAKG